MYFATKVIYFVKMKRFLYEVILFFSNFVLEFKRNKY